jgi:hypothetical protein
MSQAYGMNTTYPVSEVGFVADADAGAGETDPSGKTVLRNLDERESLSFGDNISRPSIIPTT